MSRQRSWLGLVWQKAGLVGEGLQRWRGSIGIRPWQGTQDQRIAHAAFQFLHSDGFGQNSKGPSIPCNCSFTAGVRPG